MIAFANTAKSQAPKLCCVEGAFVNVVCMKSAHITSGCVCERGRLLCDASTHLPWPFTVYPQSSLPSIHSYNALTIQYGCRSPSNTHIHMPMIMTRKLLYKKYVDIMTSTNSPPVSERHYTRLFKTFFKHVKFPRFTCLGTCNVCASTNDSIATKQMTRHQCEALKLSKQKHLLLVEQECTAYHQHQLLAVGDPGSYMSIIMDGSTDVVLPFCVPTPSSWKDLHLYKLGVHGIINHGLRKRTLYLHQGQFGCGPDFTVSVLHTHLHDVLTSSRACKPSTLYLQFDNCSCENKNKYMLAYCHWLVANQVFRSITMSFLPVGHTHEDIDQMFSTFVVGMSHEPRVATVPQFVQNLSKWYTIPQQRPIATFLYEAWSFKAWFEPYIRAVCGTSQPHAFRFERSAEGAVEMFTKDYLSTDSSWQGPDEFLRIVPTDQPSQLSPAQLDPSVLDDTLLALERMHDPLPLQDSYRSLVARFNSPHQRDHNPGAFHWIYSYQHSHEDIVVAGSLDAPINARMLLSGRATYELLRELPDVGAIAAFAGSEEQYWLGQVIRITRTRITVHWLDRGPDGVWFLTDLPYATVDMSTLIAHNVSLDMDHTMRSPLHARLVAACIAWNADSPQIGNDIAEGVDL